MRSYRSVERSREVRLWLVQIVAPAAAVLYLCPDLRNGLVNGIKTVKDGIKEKLTKKKPG